MESKFEIQQTADGCEIQQQKVDGCEIQQQKVDGCEIRQQTVDGGGGSKTPCQKLGEWCSLGLHLVTVVALIYSAYSITRIGRECDLNRNRLTTLTSKVEHMQSVNHDMKRKPTTTEIPGDNAYRGYRWRGKREVISSPNSGIQFVRGPPGPPGKDGRDGIPGRDGQPGRDGTDYNSLGVLRGVINETVQREWTKLSSSLPTYSGATFTRWGRKSCPSTSKLVYHGQMAGHDYRSAGGGVNFQCLPSDPQYLPQAPANVPYNSLRRVSYDIHFASKMFSGVDLNQHQVPCAVCETNQRVTTLSIPAMTRCPTSEWTLEYQGYLVSAAEHFDSNTFVKDVYHSTTYECIDVKAESLTGKQQINFSGMSVFPVRAQCLYPGAVNGCPPYQTGKALSCVVCSK